MKCPVCIEKGLKSTVSIGISMSTCMGFSQYYDEEGNLHVHDPNRMTTSYNCSKGHRWSNSRIGSCSNCDYGSGSESISIQNNVEVEPIIIDGNGLTFSNLSGFSGGGVGISSSSYATPQFLTLTSTNNLVISEI